MAASVFRTELAGVAKTSMLAFLIASALIGVAGAEGDIDGMDRQKVIDRVISSWLSVAEKQYRRSMYRHAEVSLARAQEYRRYMSDEQRQSVDELLSRTQNAMLDKQDILRKFSLVGALADQGRLLEAKEHLEHIIASDMLDAEQKQSAKLSLQQIDAQIERKKREVSDLYKQSRRDYKSGEFERARAGFVEVAQSGLGPDAAEDYIAKIDGQPALELQPKEKQQQSKSLWLWPKKNKKPAAEQKQPEVIDIPAPQESMPSMELPAEHAYGSGDRVWQPEVPEPELSRREKLKRSYLDAVIRDAERRAGEHVGRGEFNQGKAIVQNARKTVDKNRNEVAADFYEQCSSRISELARKVLSPEDPWPK